MKILALIAALSLTACLKDETISGQTDAAETWVLTQMNGTPVSVEVTLTFPEEGKTAGRATCNRYFADQTAPLPWFETGPIGATKMACPDLALETEYFKTLTAMTLIERQNNALLLSNEGTDSLQFTLK